MTRSGSQIFSGPIFLVITVILTAIAIHEFVRRYSIYKDRKSPLFFCYIFLLLCEIPFTLHALASTALIVFPVVFEISLAFLFTAYSLVLYSWVLIILEVKFFSKRWNNVVTYTLVGMNVLVYTSALITGLYPKSVYNLIFALSVVMNCGYIAAYWHLRKFFTTTTSHQLAVISRIANRVVGVNSVILVGFFVLALPYPPNAREFINDNKLKLLEIEMVLEVLVLLYNLRRLTPSPTETRANTLSTVSTQPVPDTQTTAIEQVATTIISQESISRSNSSQALTHSNESSSFFASVLVEHANTPATTTNNDHPIVIPSTASNLTFHSTPDTSQVFTNASIFENALTLANFESPGASQVFASTTTSITNSQNTPPSFRKSRSLNNSGNILPL